MKKLIYGFIMCLTAGTFVGCDDNNPNEDKFNPDPQSGWVQFDVAATTVLTDAVTGFNVPVALHAPVNTDGLTVTYTVTDITGSSAGAVTYTGEATVPKNTLTGNIEFTIPAGVVTSCAEFLITLTGTSRSNVQLGLGDGERPLTHTVRLNSRAALLGTYDALEDGQFDYEINVAAGEEANEIVLTNLWGAGDDAETRLFLDAVSTQGTIDYPAYTNNFLTVNDEVGDLFVSDDDRGIQGETDPDEFIYSFFNSCGTPSFDLTFFLVYAGDGGLSWTEDINVVMTKQ